MTTKRKGRSPCFETEIDHIPIKLTQRGRNSFTVQYYKYVKRKLTYDEAAMELGSCIMHAAACARRLDNHEKGET